MRTRTVLILLILGLSQLSASAEEDFFSRFLRLARRGDAAGISRIIAPDCLARHPLEAESFGQTLKAWSRGLTKAEITDLSVLSTGGIKLVAKLTWIRSGVLEHQELRLELKDQAGGFVITRLEPWFD